MFTKRIIPCLDVNNGRVVKGVNFVDLKDAGDPVEIAKAYDAAGADELVFLDITASSDGRGTVIDMVREVAKCVFIPFTVGGGIRTVEDFKALLREGADKISINSSAIANPQLIRDAADKFGSQCVVVAIDARKREDRSGWNIYKNAGRVDVCPLRPALFFYACPLGKFGSSSSCFKIKCCFISLSAASSSITGKSL